MPNQKSKTRKFDPIYSAMVIAHREGENVLYYNNACAVDMWNRGHEEHDYFDSVTYDALSNLTNSDMEHMIDDLRITLEQIRDRAENMLDALDEKCTVSAKVVLDASADPSRFPSEETHPHYVDIDKLADLLINATDWVSKATEHYRGVVSKFKREWDRAQEQLDTVRRARHDIAKFERQSNIKAHAPGMEQVIPTPVSGDDVQVGQRVWSARDGYGVVVNVRFNGSFITIQWQGPDPNNPEDGNMETGATSHMYERSLSKVLWLK